MAFRSFLDVLGERRKGRTVDELTQALGELVAAVRETGRAGDIVLTLKVSPIKGHARHAIQIADSIAVKAPKRDRDASIWFADDDNGLHRSDPNQHDLFEQKPKAVTTQPQTGDVANG